MIISLEETKQFLRVDGTYNDPIIQDLINAVPSYMETTVGAKDWEQEATHNPLVKLYAKYQVQLWYNADGTDSDRVRIVVNNLANTLKAQYLNK